MPTETIRFFSSPSTSEKSVMYSENPYRTTNPRPPEIRPDASDAITARSKLKNLMTMAPERPFINMIISIFAGAAIGSLIISVIWGFTTIFSKESISAVLAFGVMSVPYAIIYGFALAVIFAAPIMWVALKFGYAGPLTVGIVIILPLCLLFYTLPYVLPTFIVFIRSAYPSIGFPFAKTY